ncbi:hypothetical protein IKF89_02790 [Candidatus Saccharibacteria bacterium]|nr:hypothetical protein [Candidatus Saccharibacteria bacterium]
MKRRIQNFGILGVLVITLGAIMGVAGDANAKLEYSTSYKNEFTINESVSVTVPSTGLTISELVPGTVSDSGIITVNVQSNSGNGYTLNASVGNSTTYDTNQLWHVDRAAATPVLNVFDNIALNASYASLSDFTTPNTWGYSFSVNAGANWSNYNGLPLYSDTSHTATLKNTSSATAADGDNIEFKIAAKAGNAQAAGEYKNVVNFEAVPNPAPSPSP